MGVCANVQIIKTKEIEVSDEIINIIELFNKIHLNCNLYSRDEEGSKLYLIFEKDINEEVMKILFNKNKEYSNLGKLIYSSLCQCCEDYIGGTPKIYWTCNLY